MEDEHLEQAISQGMEVSFTWLNRLAVVAILYGLGGTILKLTGGSSLSLFGVSFPSEFLFFGYLALTVVHVFVMTHIVQSAAESWQSLSITGRQKIYQKLVRAGGILTKGAFGYKDATRASGTNLILDTEASQPPVWVIAVIMVLASISMIQFSFNWQSLAYLWAIGLLLVVNFQIGANWMLALADLGSDSAESKYFKNAYGPKNTTKVGSNVFGLGENISVKNYIHATLTVLFGVLLLYLIVWTTPAVFEFVKVQLGW